MPGSDGFSDAEAAFISEMGSLMERWGLPQATGRLFGYLLLRNKPVDLDTMTRELGQAKSGLSVAARQLEAWSLVRRSTRPRQADRLRGGGRPPAPTAGEQRPYAQVHRDAELGNPGGARRGPGPTGLAQPACSTGTWSRPRRWWPPGRPGAPPPEPGRSLLPPEPGRSLLPPSPLPRPSPSCFRWSDRERVVRPRAGQRNNGGHRRGGPWSPDPPAGRGRLLAGVRRRGLAGVPEPAGRERP